MNWLLETDIFDENLKELVSEVKRQGHACKVLSYESQFSTDASYLSAFPQDEPTIFYGSLGFGAQVGREAAWIPGCIHTVPNYLCTNYYPKLSGWLLNSPYIMLPYGELVNQKKFLFDTLGNNNCLFVRPNSGSKSFTGTVMESERWEKDVELAGFYEVTDNELVVVAEPKNITHEWRFVCDKNGVIAGSLYRQDGKKVEERVDISKLGDAFVVAEIAARLYKPDIAWCVDVCRLKNGSIRVIEIGCFSCCGLYACDLENVVKYVSLAAQAEWDEYNE